MTQGLAHTVDGVGDYDFFARSRRLTSLSTASRMTSRRASLSPRTASRRESISAVSGSTMRIGKTLARLTREGLAYICASVKFHLFPYIRH